jgi:hypothetical protein
MGTLMKNTVRQPAALVSTAAEEHSRGDAAAGDRAPHRQGELALPAGVGGHHDGHGRRREHRSADALDAAGDQQGARVAGQAAGERGGGEGGQAGEEHRPPVEQVGEPATEQQQAAAAQHVGADRPLVVAGAEGQVTTDARQGDVHDAHVQDDHELREQDEREGRPRATDLEWVRRSLVRCPLTGDVGGRGGGGAGLWTVGAHGGLLTVSGGG